eukprot:scaffold2752_cov393-Prasinococcus_capsulatus_cf.AAC.39
MPCSLPRRGPSTHRCADRAVQALLCAAAGAAARTARPVVARASLQSPAFKPSQAPPCGRERGALAHPSACACSAHARACG